MRGHLGHLVGRIGVYLEEGENSRPGPIRRSGCRHFQAVKEAGEVPGGLDVSMCLVIDKSIDCFSRRQRAAPVCGGRLTWIVILLMRIMRKAMEDTSK